MSNWGSEDLVEAYKTVVGDYERLATTMETVLRDRLDSEGHRVAEVSGRAKEVDSFIKKAIRKGYSDPIAQTADKAGLRISIPFARDRESIVEVAEQVLELSQRDDKREDLGQTKLGYLGIHFQAVLRPDVVEDDAKDLLGLEAELQIHTKAESAWAVAGHDSLYKAVVPPDPPVARRMMRLAALVEIFDDEITLFQRELEKQPGYQVLQSLTPPLEKELWRLSTRNPDPGLSGLIIPPVAALYDLPPDEIYDSILAPYIADSQPWLNELYKNYADDSRANPLLFQPEAFILFERLENDRFRLREAWPERLPVKLLENLGAVSGKPLD